MIKLLPILNEIKTIGNVTSTMVWDLYRLLPDDFTFLSSHDSLFWRDYAAFVRTSPSGLIKFLDQSSPQKLKQYYVELLKANQNNNLNEIKTIGNITPEMVMSVYREIKQGDNSESRFNSKVYNDYNGDHSNISIYGFILKSHPNKLKEYYIDLLQRVK